MTEKEIDLLVEKVLNYAIDLTDNIHNEDDYTMYISKLKEKFL